MSFILSASPSMTMFDKSETSEFLSVEEDVLSRSIELLDESGFFLFL